MVLGKHLPQNVQMVNSVINRINHHRRVQFVLPTLIHWIQIIYLMNNVINSGLASNVSFRSAHTRGLVHATHFAGTGPIL